MPTTIKPEDELPPYLSDEPPSAEIVQLPGTTPVEEPEEPKAKRRSPIDLERLEVDYRAAKLTTREAGAKHGISGPRVVQLAKQHGWTRDINAQARAKAQYLLAKAPAEADAQRLLAESQNDTASLTAAIDGTAQQMAQVRTVHRQLVREARQDLAALLAEVRALSAIGDIMSAYQEAQDAIDPLVKVKAFAEAVRRIQGLPSRVYAINKLALAAKNLIALERQAYDLDAPDEGAPPPPREANVSAQEAFAWLSQVRPT